MTDEEGWLVLADDFVIGTYETEDDARGVAAAWNGAYPHEPWFTVAPAAAAVGGADQ